MRAGRPRVAIVVQRYGADIAGGSESLARAVAERLASDHDVTVFTTCARDYVTWRNELPEGSERAGGVLVLRFRAEEERDLQSFNRLSESLYWPAPHPRGRGAGLAETPGPLRAPARRPDLERCKDRFEAVFFFTYLYFPTYWGLKAAPERSILVPTAHDEPPLRFVDLRVGLRGSARLRLLLCPGGGAGPVAASACGDRPTAVAGFGVETPEAPDVEGLRIRHDVRGPYVLYAGRIDAGKGCAEMLDFYGRYRRNCRGAAQLLLIGKLAMPTPRVPGVRYLGYLSEAEKMAAMAGAKAILCPSRYESLSIVLLEGLAVGTPGLVSARSPVLDDHAAPIPRRASTTSTETSSRRPSTCSSARRACARPSAGTAGGTCGRTTAGTR